MNSYCHITSSAGHASPLGASPTEKGVNFAFFSPHPSQQNSKIVLGIFAPNKDDPQFEVVLSAKHNRTGKVWHIELHHLPQEALYAYKIQRSWVLDPFAKELNKSAVWGEKPKKWLGKIAPKTTFDWEGDTPLRLPFERTIIYEMHVRGFTKDKSSAIAHPGTFLGVIEKIPHLKKLGINAVELLPIFTFDETANTHKNPKTGKKLYNYWGYSTLNFFSPMSSYGSLEECKMMVKALHASGIEVILDVVFNHVDKATFHAIDNAIYFILNPDGSHTNYTGCGNTVQCNHPAVIQFILASLKYWVQEVHIDGFRFDLASIFCRGKGGEVLSSPPIIEAIIHDPILSDTKLIAEAWDCVGLYQVGSFPGGKRFAQWNGKFRDIARRFIKGSGANAGEFAMVMSGSVDLFREDKLPSQSINFITAHDGFTLRDLVTYTEKHTKENGEEGRDGNPVNESWNCGVEGQTENPEINALRKKQMRNLLMALTFAIGTPMFLMGDEYGHTRFGNNNTYCHDDEKNHFLWNELEREGEMFSFCQRLIQLRQMIPLFERSTFLTKEDVKWYSPEGNEPTWSSPCLIYVLKDANKEWLLAFNAQKDSVELHLPPSNCSGQWKRMIDTALPLDGGEIPCEKNYLLQPFTSLLMYN